MARALARRIPASFDKNVFVNCPFDEQFQPLFRAIVFTVHDMGFRARCALEASNAGNVRIDKIQNIISQCKYSIHDLSRTQLDRRYRLPRFNMPLELGLDLGCKRFGKAHEQEKVVLVLDVEQYRYQRFISDIAGQDVYAHGGTQRAVITEVREWLRPELDPRSVNIPSSPEVISRFRSFKRNLPEICNNLHLDFNDLRFLDYGHAVATWIRGNPI